MSGWYLLASCMTAAAGVTFFLKLVADEIFVAQRALEHYQERCAKEHRRRQAEANGEEDVIEVFSI